MPDEVNDVDTRPWKTGTLLHGGLGTPDKKHWRVTHIQRFTSGNEEDPGVDDDLTLVWLLNVDPLKTPHSTVLPKALRLDYLRSRLVEVTECVRVAEMDLDDSKLSESAKAVRDARFADIEALLSPEKIESLFDPKLRGSVILRHAQTVGKSDPWIRRLLTRYWWYGCDKSALCDLSSLKGGPGKERLIAGLAKRGTPNSVAIDEPDSVLKGVNFSPVHREKFIYALQRYWIGEGMTLAKTHEAMKDYVYRVECLRADGSTYYRNTPQHRIPTLGMFYDHARSLISELGLKNANLGTLDYASKEGTKGGHARDITYGPGDIFDMDSTEFNFQLVASFDEGLRIGRPTVYLVVDRFSSCIVGLYVDCSPERWEGYRRALYCAFTQKADMLDRLDMSKHGKIWTVYGVPNGVFCDRGPARANNALKALCDEMKLERGIPPPKRPDLNAVVESLHNKMQKQLADQKGGFNRVGGQRAKDKQNNARGEAVFNEEQFLKMLIAAAHDHNTSADMSDLLLPKMGKIAGTPEAIFKWGLANSAIDHHRHKKAAELYASLLPSKSVSVSNKGVRFENALYGSEKLQEWRRKQTAVRPRINVHWDTDPKYLYWRPTAGEWCELAMSEADQQKARHMRWDDFDAFAKRNLQGRIKQKSKSHKGKIFTKVVEEVIREAALKTKGAAPTRASMQNQSVGEARKRTVSETTKKHASDGRTTMAGVLKKRTPADAPPMPLARPPPSSSNDGEPTLEELHKRVFK